MDVLRFQADDLDKAREYIQKAIKLIDGVIFEMPEKGINHYDMKILDAFDALLEARRELNK